MEVRFKDSAPERIKTDLLAFLVSEKELRGAPLRSLDRRLMGGLSVRMKKSRFNGAEGSALLYPTGGLLPAANVLLIGMGNEQEIETDSWRKAGARAAREATAVEAREISVFLADKESESQAGVVAEGAMLASYRFNKYRSESKPAFNSDAVVLFRPGLRKSEAMERSVRLALDLTPGVFLARDLVNEPPSVTTARYLAEQAERHCCGKGLSVEVWDKKKIEAKNLAGLLAVNRGSAEEPRFILIRYKSGRKIGKKIALIGKGITFDSGGLSLKTAKSMETMKLDMAGAAAIIGAMSVLPHLSPNIEVTGYIPSTDNLPSGSAQKPGDIIRYLNGKTIEVLNTDAEGRLILADALALAARERPDCMVDLATLTGACVVALGAQVAGVFGNRQPLVDDMIRCGRAAGERLWQLPLVKEYREEVKSSVADMKNVGGSHGGAIAAALILQEFVDGRPWLHLDIAGPAYAEKETPICPRGGTGFGVRTLLRFLSTFSHGANQNSEFGVYRFSAGSIPGTPKPKQKRNQSRKVSKAER